MRRKLVFILLLGLLAANCLTLNSTYGAANSYPNLEVRKIVLPGSFVNYYILHSQTSQDMKERNLIIFLRGSGLECALGLQKNGVWDEDGLFVKTLSHYFSRDFDILVPEKVNITLGNDHSNDPKALGHYSLQEVASSSELVIDTYLEDTHYQNVFLVGVSEGAAILPKVYNELKCKEKIGRIVVLGGGGLSQYEEFKIIAKSKLPMPEGYKQEIMKVDAAMKEIAKDPDSLEKTYCGLPFRRWSGFMSYRPLVDLIRIDIPIFMMHGEKDTSAPVESSRLVVEEFQKLGKTNLKYYEYKNGDHRFNGDFKTVMKIIEDWFMEKR